MGIYTSPLNKFGLSASVNGAIVCMINGQGLTDFHQTSLFQLLHHNLYQVQQKNAEDCKVALKTLQES